MSEYPRPGTLEACVPSWLFAGEIVTGDHERKSRMLYVTQAEIVISLLERMCERICPDLVMARTG